MANKFPIEIVGVDKTSKTFDQIAKNGKKLNKSFIGMKGLGFGPGGGVSRVAAGMAQLSESFGLASPLLRAAGIGAVVAAVGKLSANMGAYGTQVTRTSGRTGISGRDVQRLQGAGKLMGLDEQTVTGSVSGFGRMLENTLYGRNGPMRTLFHKLGVDIAKTAGGGPQTVKALMDVADAFSKYKDNPVFQEQMASDMGLEELLPLLQLGSQGIKDRMAKAQESGLVKTEEAIKTAEQFDRSMDRLKTAFESSGKILAMGVIPDLDLIFNKMASFISGTAEKRGIFNQFLLELTNQSSENLVIPKWLTELMREYWRPFGIDLGSLKPTVSAVPGPTSATPNRHSWSNNPGNIMTASGSGLRTFPTMDAGLEEMAAQLGRYFNRDNLQTISQVVTKYAPPSDNNPTGAYIKNVSDKTGFGPNQRIDLNDPATLSAVMKAMIEQEQGRAGLKVDAKEIGDAVAAALSKAPIQVRMQGGNKGQIDYTFPNRGMP